MTSDATKNDQSKTNADDQTSSTNMQNNSLKSIMTMTSAIMMTRRLLTMATTCKSVLLASKALIAGILQVVVIVWLLFDVGYKNSCNNNGHNGCC